MNEKNLKIPYYGDYLDPKLKEHLLAETKPYFQDSDLRRYGEAASLETPEAMTFLTDLYQEVQPKLKAVLEQRTKDRKFIDARTKALASSNQELGFDYKSDSFLTTLGLLDENERVVFGPLNKDFYKAQGADVAPYSEQLKGPQVTLFGPPESPKMAINAMNTYHRKLKGEPAIVEELLAKKKIRPRWGADLEDSKTPIRQDLQRAAENLTACIQGTLSFKDERNGKEYNLAEDNRSLPIKRFPGLALPSNFCFYKDEPIPLHVYDFALHLFHNCRHQEGLIFYVPKLENEEEAAYIHHMVACAEALIKKQYPEYQLGSVRLMIVMENPRAIVRINEIIDALNPYFLGVSLGWHDYLGSTARIFKEDPHYRIPVKADPDIVIKHIKASHDLVAEVVGKRGGITVGGMYGILPLEADLKSPSFQVALRGFFKDTITQLKRGLSGFWVAHPDFVRLGIAIVVAWEQEESSRKTDLKRLVEGLLKPEYSQQILEFLASEDVQSKTPDNYRNIRSLIVADLEESSFIKNNDPEEVRYNVFQTLQYITDWLSGNGCVALPTTVDGQAVRVMDDLATAERSRWEVWHEIYHGRFAVADLLKIALEEMTFIQKDLSNDKKIVQVRWDKRTAKWYPVAFRLMLQLMTESSPVEFATELLLPFTADPIRNAANPLSEALELCPGKYQLSPWINRYLKYYDACACHRFASTMAGNTYLDMGQVISTCESFSIDEIIEAASHHGDIGAAKSTLDKKAASEQAGVSGDQEEIRQRLLKLGAEYKDKFGFKFLISAKGLSGQQLLDALTQRITQSDEEELNNARFALGEITRKRLHLDPTDQFMEISSKLGVETKVAGVSIAICEDSKIQNLQWGEAIRGETAVGQESLFDIASLSKTLGSAFTIELFKENGISLDSSVNDTLKRLSSPLRISSSINEAWNDQLRLKDLMSHTGLNMHYVHAISINESPQNIVNLLTGPQSYGYDNIDIINQPGTKFSYSGAGFMVLEHLADLLCKGQLASKAKEFFDNLGMYHTHLSRKSSLETQARPYAVDGEEFEKGPFWFPKFAAGIKASAHDVSLFLKHLEHAYHDLDGSGAISHDTAVTMLHGEDKGSMEFMGLKMGLGVFIGKAADNRFAIHQGANEGFRALFLHCFAGPDKGKGFTILCNGDNNAVAYISQLAQNILKDMDFSGIDFEKFQGQFDMNAIAQEQIVNRGYKELVFNAFQPCLPEPIAERGPIDPLSRQSILVGAEIMGVSDQSFARLENLISPYRPSFDPNLFGVQGKIMDSWETSRHNKAKKDFACFQIKEAKSIRYISLSTEYHDGNHAARVSLYGRNADDEAWQAVLRDYELSGHSLHKLSLDEASIPTRQWKVCIYPDGGLSRLGLYESLPEGDAKDFLPVENCEGKRFSYDIPKVKKLPSIPTAMVRNARLSKKDKRINFATSVRGAKVVSVTNQHYGPADAVISPFPPIHMFDGFESARSRKEGNFEEVELALGQSMPIGEVELDFTFFRNNNPQKVSIYGLNQEGRDLLVDMAETKAYAGNEIRFKVPSDKDYEGLVVRTYPDGGFNRLRVFAKEDVGTN